MKFLCDQMLGTLAKWLRLMGFDTFYVNSEITDDEILDIAKDKERIIISRDKELIIRGKKENLKVVETKTTDLDEQLKQVLDIIDINEDLILSRCSICNTPLETIERNKVTDKVPKKVFENNNRFWFCKKCNKYYWMGSHYNKILDKIHRLTKSN